MPGALGMDYIAAHQARLFGAGTRDSTAVSYYPHRLIWSGLRSENSTYFSGATYWHAAAFIDAAPGIGGDPTGLVSYKNMLLMFRERAVVALRGDVSTDGADLGASVDVVTDGCGSLSKYGGDPCVTPEGVVFADRRSLWITDGVSVRSMIQGVIASYWRDNPAILYRTNYIDGRLVVRIYGSSTKTLVFDFMSGSWTTQDCPDYSTFAYDPTDPSTVAGFLSAGTRAHDWAADYTTTNKNDPSGTGPRMKVTTHPIPLGGKEGELGRGRVNLVLVNGYVTDAATDNPDFQVKLLYGRKGFETGATSATTLTATVDEGSDDVTTRVPVGGARAKSCVRVQVEQTAAASDARLYGLGVEYEPARVIHGS